MCHATWVFLRINRPGRRLFLSDKDMSIFLKFDMGHEGILSEPQSRYCVNFEKLWVNGHIVQRSMILEKGEEFN